MRSNIGHKRRKRTPLSTILSAIEGLEKFGDKHPPETRGQLLATAASETRRLSRFIENLLDMSRIDAGAVRARRELREVGDLVAHALDRARVALQTKVI